MYTITKQFTFSASHQLTHLPDGHKCARLHGHNYRVELTCQANTLDASGFVTDYGNLKPLEEYIKERLDHRHLNDVMGAPQLTTAEALARHIYDFCRPLWGSMILNVRVSETDKTWASYEPPSA